MLALCFTEQGSSASQMMAAGVLDVMARPPGCEGQASDAVISSPRVDMEDAPPLLKRPKSGPDSLDSVAATQSGQTRGKAFKNLWFRLKGMCADTLAGVLRERQFEKVLFASGCERALA